MKRIARALTLLPWLAGAAAAQPREEVFPLGLSAQSGAVCEAVRDYEDPAVQGRAAKAWRVRCRGFDGALGRLYRLPAGTDAGTATRATCQGAESASVGGAGLTDARRAACRATPSGATYVAYTAARGGDAVSAEGLAAIADVLETGLRIVAGVERPPEALARQVSAASAEVAADFGGRVGSLADSTAAAAADPDRLRDRAYALNNEWRFEAAETDFRALALAAEAGSASPAVRAEALLNLALNVSNDGRFKEADAYFEEARAPVAEARSALLSARALNYEALHLRNQGKFADAIAVANRALAVRGAVRAQAAAPVQVATLGQGLVIDDRLARSLNQRDGARSAIGSPVTEADRLVIQDAQAQQIIGSALAAQGDAAGARRALEEARALLLSREQLGGVVAWLRARVEADFADLDMAAGRAGPAAAGYRRALSILRTRHAGSAAEAGLLVDLGRAQARSGDANGAMATYARAFELFREQRGALGGSADAAAPYFDLLIQAAEREPARASEYASQFFVASQSAVSDATAETVARLAERVANSDSAVVGLARALDDTRRRLRMAEGRVGVLQSEGGDTAEAQAQVAALQREVDALEQQVLAANPRYGQLTREAADLKALQAALRPGESYVKLLTLGPRSYGMLVTRETARPYAIALTRKDAQARVSALRAPFEARRSLPAFDVPGASALFETLFGPVKGELLASRHLIYEPDGPFIAFPVAAFVADPASAERWRAARRPRQPVSYRGVDWLGARMDNALVVSASSFLLSRGFAPSAAPQAYIGFGAPELPALGPNAFASVVERGGRRQAALDRVCGETQQALRGVTPLPETAEELRLVGASLGAGNESLVLGPAFTDASVKARNDLNKYKVLYFATHGILPQPDACLPQPALVTSLGAGGDALLDAGEILDLKLDADLVVLAACDTGGSGSTTGEQTGLDGGGEALGGLARAVMYAGSRGLVVSHWSVDSGSAARLLTGMFQSGAATQAEGIKAAQAALQADPARAHPYYWAPFVIVGDGARAMPRAGTAS